MTNPFETKNDLSKLSRAADNYLHTINNHGRENINGVVQGSAKTTTAVAGKVVEKSKAALQELSDKLSNNNQSTSTNNPVGNKVGNKVLRKIGDKARSGIGKGKNLINLGKGAKVAKTAKTAKAVTKSAKLAKLGTTGLKGLKLAKNLKNARTAFKLAKLGKVALTGGAALAGGPVGIGLFIGALIAPYAIEAIWKNREKIYQGGKSIVSKLTEKDIEEITKAKQGQVGEIVEAKNLKIEGNQGQTLLEVDDNGQVLTNEFSPETNLAFYQEQNGEKVMVMDEEWLEDPELAINQSENTAAEQKQSANIEHSSQQNIELPPPAPPPLESETTISPEISSVTTVEIGNRQEIITPNAVIPETVIPEPEIPQDLNQSAVTETAISPPAATQEASQEMVSGIDVVQNSLENLVANNPNNTPLKYQQQYFQDTLDLAQSNTYEIEPEPQIAEGSEKISFNQNAAGSSIIDLFEANSQDGEHLATQDYDIQRRGRSYFLKDQEGNVLLEARKTAIGTKINQNNLNPTQKKELNFLQEDLEESKGITGGFKLAQRAAKKAIALTPGATMIRLFNENADSINQGEGLTTDKYNINKKGNVYQLSDKEGNVLFSAQRNDNGKIVTKGKLTETLQQEFNALQNDLSQGRPISGAFKLATRALGAAFMASPGGKIVNLFNNHSQDGKSLQTENYEISRKDNNYYVRDRQSQQLVMTAKSTPNNIESTISNNSQLKTDLENLKPNIEQGKIAGGFKPETNTNQIVSTSLTNRFEKYQTTDTLPKGVVKETVKTGGGIEL